MERVNHLIVKTLNMKVESTV